MIMNEPIAPLKRILLPYDGSPSARLALQFAAALAPAGCQGIEELTLLRVIGASYLARHIQNVDLRVNRLDQTKEWQRIRQRYLDEEILPLLAEAQEILRQYGLTAPIGQEIVQGIIGEKVLEKAREGGYAAIIMGRRGLTPVKRLILGSVSSYVMSRAAGLTVFLVGPEQVDIQASPIFPLLVPVDGSEASLGAVRQAASLAQACQVQKPEITLLHVVDLALLGLTLQEEAGLLVNEGHKALKAARQIMDGAGLGAYTREKLESGIPAQVIAREAEAERSALICMGSVGHGALARIFIGSVTMSVLQLVSKPALAVVYP